MDVEPLLEEISREGCYELLRGQRVGRLAVALGKESPLVVPVNFVLDGEDIVFLSGMGTKLRALPARPVSFQVDELDAARRVGWSVLVRGRAREIGSREVAHLEVSPWIPDGRRHFVRLRPHAVSGRRIVQPAGWILDDDQHASS